MPNRDGPPLAVVLTVVRTTKSIRWAGPDGLVCNAEAFRRSGGWRGFGADGELWFGLVPRQHGASYALAWVK